MSRQFSPAQMIKPSTRRIVTAILLLSCFLSLASQTMIVTAVPVIQHSLKISLNAAQWLTTGYTLIIGVVTPLSSNVYDKFTNRHVYLTIVGTFIIGTVLGCFAQNFWMLLAARLIQAVASGMLMTFQMTAMISIYPVSKRGTILGMSGLVISSGPALGPTMSGLLLEFFSWRSIFYFVLPFMVIIWLIAFIKLPNFTNPRPIKIDLISVIISLAGSALTLGSLTTFEINAMAGWIMLIAGLLILAVFTRRQLHLKNPMLKITIIKYPSFRLMTGVGIFAFMILLGTEQLIPIYTENMMHMGSFASGLILLPGAIVNGVAASFIGRLYDEYGPKRLIITGGILMLVASVPFVLINRSTPVWLMTVAYTIRMLGNAFVFSPALSEAFIDLTPAENSHGTALNNTLRQAFGAVSVTMLVVIAGLPTDLTVGTRAAMWVTVVMIVLMMVIFARYLVVKANRQSNH